MTAAPYPADTRAKGWRLEIDHERIDQSNTWALAKPEVRPWLLMLWLTAWKQTPCGSLPTDDDLIAAHIGMSMASFSKHRAVLMRGWWLGDDGRMYHNVLVQRVQEMLAKRAKDAARAAKSRAAKEKSHANHDGVTRDTQETNAPPTREFDTKHQAPDTKHQDKEEPKNKAAPEPAPLPDWLPSKPWAEFLAMRVKSKKPATDYARKLLITRLDELRKEGNDVSKVLDQSTRNNWQDLYALKTASDQAPAPRKAPKPEDFASTNYGTGGAL